MSTKLNPGAYNCHARALPDEPLFTLLARDPAAPDLVRTWADLRRDEIEYGERPRTDLMAVVAAGACAHDMEEWRKANDGRWRAEKAPPGVNAELLVALKIACVYVGSILDGVRDSQSALDAAFPPRSDRARDEDAQTITEIEGHLALIDAAIARAEAA